MMVSVQEPLSRKRQLVEASSGDTKRIRNELNADESNDSFSEKMYLAYVKSALDSLDMVCIYCMFQDKRRSWRINLFHSLCLFAKFVYVMVIDPILFISIPNPLLIPCDGTSKFHTNNFF